MLGMLNLQLPKTEINEAENSDAHMLAQKLTLLIKDAAAY